MRNLIEAFFSLEVPVQTTILSVLFGIIAGFIGASIRYLFEKRALRDKLTLEHEFEERKKLQQLIGRYHGRLLESATRLSHRFENILENEEKGWLSVDGDYTEPTKNYYYSSTVYRVAKVLTLATLLDSEAIYIDNRFAKQGELSFLKFTKAFLWVMTDVKLFDGLPYDTYFQLDHFFRDKLAVVCNSFVDEARVVSIEDFHQKLADKKNLESIHSLLSFIDGISPSENRLRWDRLLSFHLLLMEFNWNFGYDMQKPVQTDFELTSRAFRNRQVLKNLLSSIPMLGLSKETKRIQSLRE